MRRAAALLALLLAPVLLAQSFETESKGHNKLSVMVQPGSGDNVAYDVTVTGPAGVQTWHLTGKRGEQAEAVRTEGGLETHVRVSSTTGRVSASMQIMRGDELVDFVSGQWQLATRAPIARVGNDVKAPVVVSRVEPMYPDDARKARISGIVILECHIDATGIVRDAIILKDLPYGLGDAALAAVKQWQFEPATLDGQPVDVLFNLTVNFKLDARKPPAQ